MVIFNVFDKNLASPPVNITLTLSYLEFILSINPIISLHTPPKIPECIEALVESLPYDYYKRYVQVGCDF